MGITYFKLRERFDFSNDTLDIGNPLTWNRAQFLKHFFKRVFAINIDRLEEFYRHHLAYYLATHTSGREETFFKYLWDIVERQLKVLAGKDVYDKNHIRNEREIEQLKRFTEVLMLLDQWNFHKSNDAVIAQQDSEIYVLKQQILALKSELKKATRLDTEYHINIADGLLLTVVDLFKKMEELKTDGKELMFAQFQIIWAKMICRYFRHGGKEINFDTIRRYFPGDKENPGVRSAAVPVKNQLYNIVPIKKRS